MKWKYYNICDRKQEIKHIRQSRKTVHKNKISAKRKRMEDDSTTFERRIRESFYYDMESMC